MANTLSISLLEFQLELPQDSQEPGHQALQHHGNGHHQHGQDHREGNHLLSGEGTRREGKSSLPRRFPLKMPIRNAKKRR